MNPYRREDPPPAGDLYDRGLGPAMFVVTGLVAFVALLVSLAPSNGEYRHAWPYWPVFWAIEWPAMFATRWVGRRK